MLTIIPKLRTWANGYINNRSKLAFGWVHKIEYVLIEINKQTNKEINKRQLIFYTQPQQHDTVVSYD